MTRRHYPARESLAPSLSVHQSIELLRQRIDDFDRINALPSDDPEVKKWMHTTEAILHGAFGKPDGEPHQMTKNFTRNYGEAYINMPPHIHEREHHKSLRQKKAALESCVEQLEMLAPPAAAVAPGYYQFHAEIERVSGDLFRDGHYKPAALEAYIRVIDEVKRRSGLNLDGDNRPPVLKFNTLSTEAERDEQRGFLYLFKGIVGLRNSKAHSNRLFNDPSRAHEYLALASVLMRVLELTS